MSDSVFFFFNDTATTEIYPLSLHDALPISPSSSQTLTISIHRGAVGPARTSNPAAPPQPAPRASSPAARVAAALRGDRKSTRLNSSHDQISYAVFCLKKKKT